ncbi:MULTISPECIES: phosphotransferase [Catenuloplanes]|uniref:Aminoglycoside phosphotransferase (APT) family kinase protein n=1 Tax=Catenuloplanes niger TaxID=587534 RepID=A0AAE4CVR3_9ACTN|nr:phosphotransferase [Catenuloplanes niger]MDR7327671.1 aminoglycoside phosphotransferase (APT) family kinase protein [Catenuloplanes niger]
MDSTPRRRATRSLRTHVPELAAVAVGELGQGLDNTAFLAGGLVLRVAQGHSVLREAGLLTAIAPHVSVPVPAVRFVDQDAGVLAYPLLPGRPLLGRRGAVSRLARPLGRLLSELHAIDTATVDGLAPLEDTHPGEWLENLDGPPEMLRILRDNVPRPARRRVLAHADLGAEHILESGGAITGVIDWSDAAVTDPALDFARLYRDFGPDFRTQVVNAYGGLPETDDVRERITFFARCAALEDLAYGREHRRSEYTRAAERSLAWLFPSVF